MRVTKKLQQSNEGPSSSRAQQHDQSTIPFEASVEDTTIRIPHLAQSARDLALSFFLRSYISTTLFETYLPQMYSAAPNADDACSSAITAAAYAAFAKQTKQADYNVTAQHKYVEALSRLNVALENPQKARDDRTLLTTMMLALFEAINFKAGETPTAWINHILGTVELLKYRGHPNTESSVSASLLGHAIFNVRAMYILTLKVVPTDFVRFVRSTKPFFDPIGPSELLDPILQNLSRLGIDLRGNTRCLLFLQAADIERQIAEFSTSLFTTVIPCLDDTNPSQTRAQPSEGYVYRSRSSRFARMWNTVHLMRICLTDPKAQKTLGAWIGKLGDGRDGNTQTDFDEATLVRLQQQMRSLDPELPEELLAQMPSTFTQDSQDQSFFSSTLDLE